MSWWNNNKYFRFGIETRNETVNGQPVRMEIDSFGIGESKKTHYPNSTKYVELTGKVFVLQNVIGKIASKVSSANFTSEKENSPLLVKIQNPNNSQSQEEFLNEFATFIKAAGYTFIWKKYVSYGNFETMELININPDKTEINTLTIETVVDDKSETINFSDLIIFYDSIKNSNNKKGYSRITPLKSQIDNILNAQKAKGIQIENSGTTIVSPKQTAAGNNIDEGLNAPVPVLGRGLKTQKEEMEDRFNTRGLENRIIVSSKGLDAKNLSTELNTVKFYEIVETDILAVYDAYDFPIELSPYGKNATFENKEIAEVTLIENAVMPLTKNLVKSLNSEFPTKGPLDVDFNHLNSMSIIEKRIQETNGKTIDQYGILHEKKIISDKEYKDILVSKKILS